VKEDGSADDGHDDAEGQLGRAAAPCALARRRHEHEGSAEERARWQHHAVVGPGENADEVPRKRMLFRALNEPSFATGVTDEIIGDNQPSRLSAEGQSGVASW